MTTPNKSPREVMEEAAQELETQAELDRIQAETNPLVPAPTPLPDEEHVPTHEIPPEHRVPPQRVIDEENLGA
ncbi:MAG TPA: hypothetical protein VMJ72_02355 [Candidatus Paceibacterota bacterium]|nr:hypothetical protein [Candidatus Paceibacterota bacterium]